MVLTNQNPMKPVAFLLLYFVNFTIKAQDVQWAVPSVDFNNGKLKVADNHQHLENQGACNR